MISMSKKYHWKHCGSKSGKGITVSDLRENREIRCPYCNELISEEEKVKAEEYFEGRKWRKILK